jgi:hypothetical protein
MVTGKSRPYEQKVAVLVYPAEVISIEAGVSEVGTVKFSRDRNILLPHLLATTVFLKEHVLKAFSCVF